MGVTGATMDAAVSHQIWNYIGMLGIDRETARDLYQEAETAVWEASEHRATRECHAYLVKTGVGAIRHWLRDRYSLIRIPGYLHDRKEAGQHMKTIVPLEDVNETGEEFEEECLDRLLTEDQKLQIITLLPRLTRAERQVMAFLLLGFTIREIARIKRVRGGCVYAQRSKAIAKLKKWISEEDQSQSRQLEVIAA